MTSLESVRGIFDRIMESPDIPSPQAVLKVKADKVAIVPPGHKYSMIQQLAHAVLWQEFWLKKLDGGRKKSGMNEWKDNFRVPEASEWEDLRARFVSGLEDAVALCRSGASAQVRIG